MNSTLKGLTLAAMMLVGGLALGGCGGDDDDGNSGGGSAGAVYPQVPTARPTLTGMPVALNASGGQSTGTAFGGNGGDIAILAYDGRLMLDDGRARPGVDNNFLTAAVLAGGSVTWTELTTLDASVTVTIGTTVHITLNGQDFFVPAGVTLDLSGAPAGVDLLQINVQGSGDVIRIDGPVNGVRLTDDSIGLGLLNINAPGTAISVDGNVDLSGYDAGVLYHGGAYAARAYAGGVIQTGAVDTSGNTASAASGGNGGSIDLVSFTGDIILRAGVIQSDGGSTTGGSTGGDAGTLSIRSISATLQRFEWGLRTRGGLGLTTGGFGGPITVDYDGPLDAFIPFLADSGNATSGASLQAGNVAFKGLTVQGAIVGTANGGQGGTGGNGGAIDVEGESLFGLAFEVSANGGVGTSGNGGNGGAISVYVDGAVGINLLVSANNSGGQGAVNGGSAGSVNMDTFGELRNVDFTSVGNGGQGTNGNGGGNSSGFISQLSPYGEAIVDSTFDFTRRGGNGLNGGGGNAGNVSVNLRGSDRNNFTLLADCVGGDGTTSQGGTGGFVRFQTTEPYTADISVTATLDGGDATSGNGGNAGSFEIIGNRERHVTLRNGPINARGGTSNTGSGGTGGLFQVTDQGQDTSLTVQNIALDLSGGTVSATGVNGGSARNGASFAVSVIVGRLRWLGGSITANGADAGTTGNGGAAGRMFFSAYQGGTDFTADIFASGGDATDNLSSGGNAGALVFTVASVRMVFSGDVTINGGQGGSAAGGGTIALLGIAITEMDVSGIWTANGGLGVGVRAPTGGVGGSIDVGQGTELQCLIRAASAWTANGGGPSAAAGLIDVDVTGLAGANLTIETGATFTTNNGAGTAVPANIDLNQNN